MSQVPEQSIRRAHRLGRLQLTHELWTKLHFELMKSCEGLKQRVYTFLLQLKEETLTGTHGEWRGFSERHGHGGGLPQLHKIPHVRLQLLHLSGGVLPAGCGRLGAGGPHGFPGDRGCQPPPLHRRLRHPGHGRHAVPAGFLGCCGAIRENKCLLLFFFMLILIIFLAELAAAILAFIFREHLTREYFTRELKRHYQGYNNTDVFTSTWNAIMTTFDCCGVNSPEDFEDSLFRHLNPTDMVPEACCQRNSHPGDVAYISKEECLMGSMLFRHNKGCYSAVVDYFETYIYVAGALAIVVLTIELFAMVFAMCLFRGIQ
ncbi:hypothetical protein COCON_G00103390 [Conger conger]|uniref:Tetraspanin n=1 Tax=Conger conger TaxID=82655 RepID=A0A9Q1DI47_CONCO|nr:hypothetical protein COCON_G00103390 [Conger conger]